MITTTLNRIRAHSPCAEGWRKLLAHLGKTEADDEPLPFATIVASNGFDDALWCCRVEPQHAREWRLFAVWCARRMQSADTDEELRQAAAWAARGAAWAAAWEAARAARETAAWQAARAAWPAPAWEAARAAERNAQTARFLEVVS